MKVLITGGCRSGKSRRAQALAESLHPVRTYLATGQALDEEMAARIARHRDDRGPSWRTVEQPLAIEPLLHGEGVVLVDCLTLWVSNLMHAHGPEAEAVDLRARFEALARAIAEAPNPIVLVTNEVGMGIVPMNPLARAFRDQAGWCAQAVAEVCDRVELCVAGQVLWVKG